MGNFCLVLQTVSLAAIFWAWSASVTGPYRHNIWSRNEENTGYSFFFILVVPLKSKISPKDLWSRILTSIREESIRGQRF